MDICKHCSKKFKRTNGNQKLHPECVKSYHATYNRPYSRDWYQRKKTDIVFKEKWRIRQQQHRIKVKLEVIKAYGGRCTCCGETEVDFLTMDHINGRKESNRSRHFQGETMFKWAKQHGCPRDLRLHCFNCNAARSFPRNGGVCPHQQKKENTI